MPRVATGESTIARAVRVFDAFNVEERSLSVSEIARRSRLHVATASRLIAELTTQGLLERGQNREVRLGVRLWELASRASPTLSLREAAMPFLEDVHALVGHHAQLGVLDNDEVLYLERLSARDAVINYTRVAGRLPIYCSASGHVLAAFGPSDLQERALALPMRRHTDQTITSQAELRAAFEQVRAQGYALLPGHLSGEVTGVAVPVRNVWNDVVASLAVVVPNDGRADAHVRVLIAAARGLGRTLAQDRGRGQISLPLGISPRGGRAVQ